MKLLPKPGNSPAGVLYFVEKLESPSDKWEVVYETNEKCNMAPMVYSNVYMR